MKFFLIGMMGVGKTYWAAKLARKIKASHYDLDNLIETLEEASISEIFAEKGEDYFRKTESKILYWFAEKKSFILATGGGTPCFADNMQWMNKTGITIWIDEPIDVLSERLIREKENRPLIKNLNYEELRAFLENKLKERIPYYEQAQYRLQGKEISDKSLQKIIHEHA